MSDSTEEKSGVELAEEAVSKADAKEEEFDFAEALRNLSPEEAEMFARALDMTLRRRRLLLWGYMASLFTLVAGLIVALYVYGTREPGTFVGWVFLLPFTAVGIVLWIFGRLAKSSKPAGGLPSSHEGPTENDPAAV